MRVRGFHCDAYGHVNNARYLEFFEEARWAGLEAADLLPRFKALGLQFFIVEINLQFKRAVLPGLNIEIHTFLGDVGRKTITFHQQIWQDGNRMTEARITFVLYDVKAGRAATLNSDLVKLFDSFKDA